MAVEFLKQTGQKLFDGRFNLLSLWQEIAEHFYPQRADFTVLRNTGQELTTGLATGFPIQVHRDLTDAIGGMLRPTNKIWAHSRVPEWDTVPSEERAWLEMTDTRQRRVISMRETQFSKATKQADADFAAFGQCVLQESMNSEGSNILIRCWHLRDVAWRENSDGFIDTVFRKWKSTNMDLDILFNGNVADAVKRNLKEHPMGQVNVWHCVVPSRIYHHGDQQKQRKKFVSIYLDVDNDHVMQEVPMDDLEYVIPRWQTVSGSQYAYSPATVIGLPDGRTLQEMTFTLLEAGEKAVTPPLLGVQGALRSDVNVMAGGLTWVDREYDERLGEVLRPLTIDKSGIPLGMDMALELKERLREAFYLNKLSLPPQGGPEMTAFEAGQRVQEYIRQALPLFEPLETEYNAPLWEKIFDRLLKLGVFGSPFDIPRGLQGKDITFHFESPLHEALERQKSQKFLEASSLVANAGAADPSVLHVIDTLKAARDALHGAGVPADWLRSEGKVAELVERDRQAQETAQALQQMQQGADIAATIGSTPTPAGTAETGSPLI